MKSTTEQRRMILFTWDEAADYVNASKNHLRNLEKEGLLHPVKIGVRAVRIHIQQLEVLAQRGIEGLREYKYERDKSSTVDAPSCKKGAGI